jgi:Amt family ammonium transporter
LHWDDALDVWGVHGVGGVLGTIMLGVFGSVAINANGQDGLIFGGTNFFLVQVVSVLVIGLYAFLFTYAMLWLINKVTPVKVSKEVEVDGLDGSLHGEIAYEHE